MDIFRGIGNWFKGAFGGDDEEKKRRLKQQQDAAKKAAQPKQQPKAPLVLAPKDKGLDVFGAQKPKPVVVAPKPVAKVATPASTTVPVKKPVVIVDTQKQSLDALKAQPVFTPQKQEQLKAAPNNGTRPKEQTVMDVAKGTYNVGANIIGAIPKAVGEFTKDPAKSTQGILRTPFRAGASIARSSGDKTDFQSNPIRRFFFGDEPIVDAVEAGQSGADLTLTQEERDAGKHAEISQFAALLIGLGLLSSDATPLGGLKKGVIKNATKAGENTAETVTKEAAREAEKQIAKETAGRDIRGELETIVSDPNEPAFRRKQAQEALDTQPLPEKPTPTPDPIDAPAYEHKREIQNVVTRETQNFDRYVNEHPDLTPAQLDAAKTAAKDRIIKLTDELKASRLAGDKTIEDQAATQAATQNELKTAKEEVVANQAKTTAPGEGEKINPETGTAEADANNAYADFNKEHGFDDTTSDIGYMDAQQTLERTAGNKTLDDLTGRQAVRIPANLNEKGQGAVANAVTNTAGNITGTMARSQSRAVNAFGQLLQLFNRKSTLNNAEKTLVEQARGRQGGIGNLRNDVVTKIDEPLAKFDPQTQAVMKENVFKAFEEYNNGNPQGATAIIKQFTPDERAYFDSVRQLNILRNDLNRDVMDADLIKQFENGMHMPRLYDMDAFAKEFNLDDVEQFARTQGRTLDLNPNKRRQQLEEISKELQATMLRDPAQASVIRTEIALHNKGVSDYSAQVSMLPDAVSDVDRPNFLPMPDNPRFGALAGKYVYRPLAEPILSGDGRFKSEAYQKISSLLDKYQTTIFGKVENGLRKALTAWNPATRLGNRGANLTQGAMAGFNLPEMAVAQQHFMNVIKKGGDEWTRLARAYGAIDDYEDFAKFSGVTGESKIGVLNTLNKSYSATDAGAKVAMFKWRINKGATPEEAARFVNRALPNIGNSGEIYSFFSRLPVLGVPFRAIQPEVLRSLGSTMGRNTVPFLVAMTTYTTLQNMTWDEVSEEEKKQIQARFGSGKTPFKGINDFFGEKGIPSDKVLPSSWSVNAAGIPGIGDLFGTDPETGEKPVVDVDPRRLMGMYSINLGGDSMGDSIIDQGLKASPAPIPFNYNDDKFEFAPQNLISSRTFSPLWQSAIDRDYRGKSVQDPEGKIYNKDGTTTLKYTNPQTGKQEAKQDLGRVGEFLARSYVPQLNDAGNIKDAYDNKENFNGQVMNVPQAIGRFFGLKGEQFNDKRLQDMRDTEKYFTEKEQIDKEVANLPASDAEAYKRLTGYYKLREKVPNEFEPGATRDKKAPQYDFGEDKWKEYAAHPKLYDLMVDKKQREAANDGKPLQPEFDPRLSESFRKQIIQNKMVAPGDDAELDQRMYSSPEWDYYMGLKDEYKAKAKQYYPETGQDDFTDELVKHQDAQFPAKPDALKAYSAAYAQYADGKAANKPEFTDQVKAAREEYNKQTLNWTNIERKARGLPAITWDVWNNPTFGFDSTPSGSGYGNSDYNAADHVNTTTDLTNFSDSITRFAPVEAANEPNIVAFFQKLMAGSGGGRAKPKIGASSSGR